MSKVYLEPERVEVPQEHRDGIVRKLEQTDPSTLGGDHRITLDGVTYAGTVLVTGARQDITFRITSAEKAAPKKAAAKKAAPKKAAARK